MQRCESDSHGSRRQVQADFSFVQNRMRYYFLANVRPNFDPPSKAAGAIQMIIKPVRDMVATLQQEFDTAEGEKRENVAVVQKQVQKQAAEKIMCPE
ncbi:MAG: hypothetical protein FRX49_03892 [Trebouxia sp. A1-2]|nr:MAG: hypothetical protein FRX49_03892 [Trebouxia sp. A1-2]